VRCDGGWRTVTTDLYVADEAALIALGRQLAGTLIKPFVVTLAGEPGAGKSVLARAIIHALGCKSAVKSPTYTLVETYVVDHWRIAHMDLYRLQDPDELQCIGFRDIVADTDLLLIEWPERAVAALPDVDLAILIRYAGAGRSVRFAGSVSGFSE
jgi:tRNA threonylcarbamoyladenosine biosynthesis protein TsaE